MCGIAGFLAARGSPPAPQARLRAMIATLRHRGPDDEGVWSDGRVGLAHARLSIIDLSPTGHQPMSSADGEAWITYNGEIYNFAELRRELEAVGCPFRGRSDTEVVVNGWRVWGPGLFLRLRGMFAMAIWDRPSQQLILARDRIGKKPLYHASAAGSFLFGSEIKAVLAWPGVERTPSLAAIDRYLSLGYVPAGRTAFAGIEKLPAAHYLVVARRPDGDLAIAEPVRYWRLPRPRAARPRPPVELQRELVVRLEEAVRLRLVADVPLGAFLSGGVDSSAVVATMARVGGGRVKTFSIGFAAREYDETRYARMVAERYGTEHEEMVVEPDAVAVLPRLVWHYGEPFADPSAIPTYYVSEMARRHVTVALNGDGGDECFLGYNRYRAMRHLARLDRLPHGARVGLERALGLAPAPLRWRSRIPRIRAMLRAAEGQPVQRYGATMPYFTDRDKADGYGDAMAEVPDGSALDLLEPYFTEAGGLVAGANWADLHTYLPDDLMVKVDVASMAHGLEARSPLLDHELMTWAAGIPAETHMAGGESKALFKAAMQPYLPKALLYRPKMGFGCPIDRWLRNELKELAYDTLLGQSARQRGLVRFDYVQRLLDEHCGGGRDHHAQLWALLMLELWFRMWIDAPVDAAMLRPAA